MTTPAETSSWETEIGLPNDFDGWITNPRFGYKDEYAQAVQATGGEGVMFIMDLIDENGELVGSPGYSIGTGWIVSEDGKVISHPKRKNVVNVTRYGILQNRVRKDLGVKMEERGLPTNAMSWDGLGFHWMQEEHPTVSGEMKTSLMPVELLTGKATPGVATPAAVVTPVADPVLELKLKELAQSNSVKDFQKAALKLPAVVVDDNLMAGVLDEGPTGFWATHQ